MLSRNNALLFAVSGLFLSGCVTMVRGTTHEFNVTTNPPGAAVTTTLSQPKKTEAVSGGKEAVKTYGCSPTPCSITIPRRSTFIVRIEKDGFVPVAVAVRSRSSLKKQPELSAGIWAPPAVGAVAIANSAAFTGATTIGAGAGMTAGALYVAAPMTFVDAATGSMLDTYPNPISLNLLPASESDLTVIYIDPDEILKKRKSSRISQSDD